MSKFIDISEHNIVNNYSILVVEDLKGVIIKATEGTTYKDSKMEGHYSNINSKLPVGFYHYLTVSSSPITQAEAFWKRIKDKTYEIYPVLDVEQEQLGDLCESYSKTFIERFKELSEQDMIIYSGRCFAEEHFSDEFKNNHVWWIADYSASQCPKVEGCNVIAWQYTESCSNYPSVFGSVDCSILVDESKFFIKEEIPYSDESILVDEYDSVLELQKELNRQCYTDSNWDELIEDGVAGEKTLSACPTLQIGATGNITKWVQEKLGIQADGVFGEQTRQAVIEYQENMSLNGDGIVGKKTWSKLLGLKVY
jgi:hypothetical protein